MMDDIKNRDRMMKKDVIGLIEEYFRKERTQKVLNMESNECTRTLEYSEVMLKHPDIIHDYEGQVNIRRAQSRAHLGLGNTAKAKQLSAKTKKLAHDKCTRSIYAYALIESGYVHMLCLEYRQAERLTVDALVIARDDGLCDREADALVQLALLGMRRQHYQQATVYLREAHEKSKIIKRVEATLKIIIQQGLVKAAIGDYTGALELFEWIESLSRKDEMYAYEVESILNQADVFRSVGDFDKAERLYLTALDKADNHWVDIKLADFLKRIGNLLLHTRDFERALKWYRFCEGQLKKFESKSSFPFVALGFGTAYNGLEDYKRAVKYFWRVLDTIAPNYSLNSSILKQVLDQLSLSLGYLNKDQQSKQVGELTGKLTQLSATGVDDSYQSGLFIKKLENELNILIESLKTEQITMFSRDGVRVDMRTGEIYGDGKLPRTKFTELQLEIFRLLVENEGTAVSNKHIIGCYEKYVDDLQEVPRRAHYFIAEIRKKLGSKTIIKTVTGSGYKIPRL